MKQPKRMNKWKLEEEAYRCLYGGGEEEAIR